MTTDRKTPPPMWAAWEDTYGTLASFAKQSRSSANDDLVELQATFPGLIFRLVKLVPQEESE